MKVCVFPQTLRRGGHSDEEAVHHQHTAQWRDHIPVSSNSQELPEGKSSPPDYLQCVFALLHVKQVIKYSN